MNTAQTKPVYTCRPPSLAHSVISFFVTNPDEVMTAEDIVNKWDAKHNSLSGLLLQAKKSGAITHNGGLYMLGDMATAKLCIDPDAAPDLPAPKAPTPAPAPALQAPPQPAPTAAVPAPGPRSIDDASGGEWNAASAAIRAQQQRQQAMKALHRQPIHFPGIGTLTVSVEPLASRIPVSGHKWDPLLDYLASQPPSEVEGQLVTARLPKALTGAAKAGIESWHKRHADIPFPCRFRASVSGDQVLIQRIA